jgi:hypothetical protein
MSTKTKTKKTPSPKPNKIPKSNQVQVETTKSPNLQRSASLNKASTKGGTSTFKKQQKRRKSVPNEILQDKTCQILNKIYTKKELIALLPPIDNAEILHKNELCKIYTTHLNNSESVKLQNANINNQFTIKLEKEDQCPVLSHYKKEELIALLEDAFPDDLNRRNFKDYPKTKLCALFLDYWLKSGKVEEGYLKTFRNFNKSTLEEKTKFVNLTYELAIHFNFPFKKKDPAHWIVNSPYKTAEDYLCKQIAEKLALPWTSNKRDLVMTAGVAGALASMFLVAITAVTAPGLFLLPPAFLVANQIRNFKNKKQNEREAYERSLANY